MPDIEIEWKTLANQLNLVRRGEVTLPLIDLV